ncbi:ERF family protein [Nocardia puris]|uniref:ERF family protein n=1 Tax=Nocardia puris TaxID=208602 RepID=UPI002E2518B7
MTDHPTIFEALSAVMAAVRAVEKKERNTAPGANYTFRGVDAVTNAVGPALRDHGVIVAPRVLDWQYGTVEAGKNRTQMSHARLLIEFTWYGPAGDSLVTVAAGEAFDSGDKATAKAHSVAFRTAMIQTLCLPTDEPDPNEQHYERSAAESVDPATVARTDLLALLKEIDVEPAEAADRFAADGHGNIGLSTDAAAIRGLIAHYKTTAGRS